MNQQRFVWSYELPSSLQEVFAWHMQPHAIQRLIPPWAHAEVLASSEPNKIGSPIKIRFHAGPFFKDWILQHTGFMQNDHFIDEQVSGPFRNWKHTHKFVAIGENRCKLLDGIEYCLPVPFLNKTIERELIRSFRYREQVLTADLRTYAAYPRQPLRILMSGSSGFIGAHLMLFLQLGGHSVTRLRRAQSSGAAEGVIFWNPETGDVRNEDFEGFDVIIHLAGETIASMHWTAKKKEKIFQSRCRDTWLLSQVLTRLKNPPKTLISASAVGYYGDRGDEVLSESSSNGQGFLADVCKRWEDATETVGSRGTRVVHPRFGAVLSPTGGMLKQMLPAYKWGLGGKLGDGEQFIPWIALDDLLGALYHILFNPELDGAVNCTAPNPVRQKDFARELADAVHRPSFGNIPKPLLKALAGEMAENLLLAGQRAIPERLVKTGYNFRFTDLPKYFSFAFGPC